MRGLIGLESTVDGGGGGGDCGDGGDGGDGSLDDALRMASLKATFGINISRKWLLQTWHGGGN